jgi:hypothetical protein
MAEATAVDLRWSIVSLALHAGLASFAFGRRRRCADKADSQKSVTLVWTRSSRVVLFFAQLSMTTVVLQRFVKIRQPFATKITKTEVSAGCRGESQRCGKTIEWRPPLGL